MGVAAPCLVNRRSRDYAECGVLEKPAIRSRGRRVPAVRLVRAGLMHPALEAVQLLFRQTVD